jgi:hypothetical protein
MQHAFNQLLQFLQQGISAIFHFVQMIWTWSVGQISTLLAVPWQQWPLWKQILLVLVLVGVIWALYKAAIELFAAGERILLAFARFTYRSCTHVAEHRICRVDCSCRCLVDKPPRQQFDSAARGV